ncbi:tetratricopeptide repeat protein [Gluconobacter wancherniae]|uniref:Tetratricopeptide repeat protein 38 n=1 Tax=Gluconobacter wancherniae NBRC 103581 TaxID=656744 RepID=A0A511B4M4_9PROT|nr:tetratricopeptide repeat protein [Gluconobacter wancherniae]GBD57820.1 tetratricopeptide repeat protein 38 family protein [Gluconobacter wancherniae NBRC 103581]GBR61990.1 hypothetical protein AA103581_0082 [Gluconobacter wancherniae NBRC 103581]GEK94653.1 tetratricopeptide repeat protein 38 family protein [Gluconobacter wancherniae NBRC 103581]
MTHDTLGNDISATDTRTVDGINAFVSGYLGYELKLAGILETADQTPDCLANVYAGLLWMLSETGDVPIQARDYLERASKNLQHALPREKLLFGLLNAWVNNQPAKIIEHTDHILSQWPRDLVTLKIRHYHDFIHGRFEDMLTTAQRCAPAAGDVAALHGMLAFSYEQCHDLKAAETAARHALKLDPSEPWSQHALAHVLLTENRIDEGIRFLEANSGGWGHLTSFMYTHLWWHLALFYLAQGRKKDALRVYDEHCWARERSFSQDQVGAVSLLVRLELAGVEVDERWAQLADWLAARQNDVSQPFLTLQYLYGLLRARRPEGKLLLEKIEQLPSDKAAWDLVGKPLSRGIAAYLEQENAKASSLFDSAMPHLQDIGGSHAQRDLFLKIRDNLRKQGFSKPQRAYVGATGSPELPGT